MSKFCEYVYVGKEAKLCSEGTVRKLKLHDGNFF